MYTRGAREEKKKIDPNRTVRQEWSCVDCFKKGEDLKL